MTHLNPKQLDGVQGLQESARGGEGRGGGQEAPESEEPRHETTMSCAKQTFDEALCIVL